MMDDVDPAEVAAEMLREALPGFEALIHNGRGQIEIRGGLPIKGALSAETVYFAVPRAPMYDNVFRDFREIFAPEDPVARARRREDQTKAIKLHVAPIVGRMVDEVQRFAIDAVGLEPVIASREAAAETRGRRHGFEAGREKGRREGRAELLREWQEAAAVVRAMLDEMPGTDDDEE